MTDGNGMIECYSCNSRQSETAEACGKCGAAFQSMCGCGTEVSKFASNCAKCGAAVTRRNRRPPTIFKKRRVIGAPLLLAVVGATPAPLFFKEAEGPPSRPKQTGVEKVGKNEFSGA